MHSVMFYPGTGADHGPLIHFAQELGYTHFVFADYDVDENDALAFLHNIPGWKVMPSSLRRLSPEDFGQRDWGAFWHRECPVEPQVSPFGTECVLMSQEGRRVMVRYLGVDAFGCLEVLLTTPGWHPDAITLQDHGFGGNWSTFGGRSQMFDAARQADCLPELLLVGDGTEPWPGYEAFGEARVTPGQMHGHARRMYRREG